VGRILLLLWVALAVAFAPLGSIAHARGHTAPQMHHHHDAQVHHAHHHHHHDKLGHSCKDCDAPAKGAALKDCCQLGCQMVLAQAMPDAISFESKPGPPHALAAQYHTGTEPAQSDPPPRA